VVQQTLHLPCPGCGLGRSLLALGRLEIGDALAGYPPLALLGLAYLLGLGALLVRLTRRRQSILSAPRATGLAVGIVVLVLVNWLVRLTGLGAIQ
jgi:hypothetical protein